MRHQTTHSSPNFVHSLFETQAAQTPQASALTFQEATLTFDQLNQQANQLAHYLLAQGVTPGTPVGISLNRSLEMVVALLAILKSGGCYVALDPTYPRERLQFMAKNSTISLLITHSTIAEAVFENGRFHPILLDQENAKISQMPTHNPNIALEEDAPLYILYTSGSTGVPKGVVGHHQGALNRFEWMWITYPFQDGEIASQKTTLNFVDSVWEIWGPLLKGVPTVLIPDTAVNDPRQLVPTLAKHHVSRLVLVPSLLKLLLDVYPNLGEQLPALKIWTTSGETLTYDLYRRFKTAVSHATLLNIYGSSEVAADATCFDTTNATITDKVLIGQPIANLTVYVLDEQQNQLPLGEQGELYISGIGVAHGYFNQPELTAERFMLDPFVNDGQTMMFKSGDYGRIQPDGNIEYLGRADQQVKIRGNRVELGEIEAALLAQTAVKEAIVTVRDSALADKQLVAYIVPKSTRFSLTNCRTTLANKLPDYMLPSAIITLDAFPLTPNGKIDRNSLPAPETERPLLNNRYVQPRSTLEKQLAAIWEALLFVSGIGVHDSFFELGGDSLLAVRMVEQLRANHNITLNVTDLFEQRTIRNIVNWLEKSSAEAVEKRPFSQPTNSQEIAIIGMAGRFPKAKNIDQLWHNLLNSVEGLRFLTDDELRHTEIDFNQLKQDPDYVPATGILDDIDQFDAEFFGIQPAEARLLDPQQRLWLEVAWETLENAGYVPSKFKGDIGVFAGSYMNSYLLHNLLPDREAVEGFVRNQTPDALLNQLTNERDYLPTRTAHLLNLTGPAINVQTACSTSLVAVAMACDALINGRSDLAIAGGVSIFLPQERGYFFQEGGILSQDGHCKPFDASASGTVFASGLGAVLLKRLDQAIADGDNIVAVIKGSAINNDGRHKASYTAPSIDGQIDVILKAQQAANVTPDSISYVEAHATATPVGDPIEVTALSRAFQTGTDQTSFCGIGSIKSNIGHLDAAAGIAGLIKTVLALQHETIPPTLHYQQTNPAINFKNSPFYVIDQPTKWERTDKPRRAGVSSFGMGGTNVHTIVEEAPQSAPPSPSRPRQLLLLSARSEAALAQQCLNVADYLAEKRPFLPNVAYTLNRGRADFAHRRTFVVTDLDDAITQLRQAKPRPINQCLLDEPRIVFMFPGQGSQFVGMGRELYETEPVYKAVVDECAEYLRPLLNLDLRHILYPADEADANAAYELTQTDLAQPAIFVVSYALAKTWQAWGVQPSAFVGHSVGEYVGACLAGVFSLEDALTIIAQRGKLMQALPSGAMCAVRLSPTEVAPFLSDDITLAAHNAPEITVLSGTHEAMAAFNKRMEAADHDVIQLHTSHAFHSAMMEPILAEFTKIVAQTTRNAPTLPTVSTLTGKWLSEAEATDPSYWASQLRHTVRFSDAIETLKAEPYDIYLEVGPGKTLSSATLQHDAFAIDSLGHPQKALPSLQPMLTALGQLWQADAPLNWNAFYQHETRQRLPLPTYPFERERFWVEAVRSNKSEVISDKYSVVSDQYSVGSDQHSVDEPTQYTNYPIHQSPNTPITQLPNYPIHQSPTTEESTPMNRIENITTALTSLLLELSGIEISAEMRDSSFLELGFDSLLLTQVSSKLKKELKINIRFRKFLEDVSTMNELVAYCADQLPADAFAEEPTTNNQQPTFDQQPPQLPNYPITQLPPTQSPNLPISNPLLHQMAQQQQAALHLIQQQQQTQLALMAQMGGETAVSPPQPQQPTEPKRPKAPAKKEGDSVNKVRFGPYKPLQRGSKGKLTEQQQTYLDSFIERLTSKTAGSKALAQKNRDVQADPRTVAGFRQDWKEIVYQIATNRSKGAKLWDIDGNEYVDMTCGFGVNFFGNSPDFVTKAVIEQIEQGVELGPQAPLAGEVARLLREITGMDRVSFCNTGSEGIMAALRMARTVTGRDKVVYFSGDYHGVFDEALARSQTLRDELYTLPAAPGITEDSVSNTWILDYGTQASLDFIRDNKDEIAAVLIETVQSRYPENRPFEFVRNLRDLTKENEIALVFDEVVTGFRVHPGGMQKIYDVQPDLACYGKIVGGGYPIGIVAGDKKYMDSIDGGWWQYGDDSVPEVDLTFFAGTFVRHRVALAAAKAVLLHLKANGSRLQDELNEKTAVFAHDLNCFFEEQGVPIKINHYSSWFRVEVAPDYTFGDLIFYHLIEKGVFVFTFAQNCFLSTAHTDEDIQHIINAFKQTVFDMQSGGFLPVSQYSVVSGQYSVFSGQYSVDGEKLEKESDQSPNLPIHQSPNTPITNYPITNEESSTSGTTNLPIHQYTNTPITPLSRPQVEMWFPSQHSDLASTSLNESFHIRFAGEVKVSALQRAVETVLMRHEGFHMRFLPYLEGQYFAGKRRYQVPLIDLSNMPLADAEAKLEACAQDEQSKPFDLENGPLARVFIVKLDAQHVSLLWYAHHIVFDGWSSSVVIDELKQLYNAEISGEPVLLPPPDRIREYVAWEQSIDPAEKEAIQAYWQKEFTPLPTGIRLPNDFPRPETETFEGKGLFHTFDTAVLSHIQTLARQYQTSPFVIMLAVFKTMIYRVSGENDLLIGIHTAGQPQADLLNLVGHMVGTLPIRTRLAESLPFEDFVEQVKQKLIDGQDMQPFSLSELMYDMIIPREPSKPQIGKVYFNLDRKISERPFLHTTHTIREISKTACNVDLFLNLYEDGDVLRADCDYSTALFKEETIRHMLNMMQNIVLAVGKQPTLALGEIPLVSDTEAERQIVALNDTAVSYPKDKTAAQLITEQAARTPDKVAVADENEFLTYQELEETANQLAHYLIEQGVSAGDLVGVSVDRTVNMVIAVLAIMKAGGTYLPLDPTFPQKRLAFIMQDSEMAFYVAEAQFLSEALPKTAVSINLDQAWDALDEFDSSVPDVMVGMDTAVYMMYTSGSTGQPKGVKIPHRALTNFLTSMQQKPGISEDDILLAVTTFSFDIAGLELYLPLISGAKLVIAANELGDGAKLAARLVDEEATIMQATPTTWQLLLDSGWQSADGFKMLCGGEAMPPHLAKRLTALPGELWNMYGPTETTIWSAISKIEPDAPITIGRPIANTSLFVLDAHHNLLPFGAEGELYIGGDGLALGYHNRPELTAERFIDNPFGAGKLYKTGDLARYAEDGQLICLGRNDSQIKIRGLRIELGEIEQQLSQQETVQQAVVHPQPNQNGEQVLVAYLVLNDYAPRSDGEWRNYLLDFLPNYMVPITYVTLQKVPLTPNNKVDRLALPNPLTQFKQATKALPETEMERKLARLWQSLLGIEQVGKHDDFFVLGGHSLLTIQLANQIREQFGVEMSLGAFFQQPRLAQLAEHVETAVWATNHVSNGKVVHEQEEFEI